VRSQIDARQPWERAECHLLEQELRDRLTALGVTPSADVAVALMAAAMLIAGRGPEWGGDYRDGLGDIAALGCCLIDGGEPPS
jgi:hypothetical protein